MERSGERSSKKATVPSICQHGKSPVIHMPPPDAWFRMRADPMWNPSRNAGKSVQRTGRNNFLLLNSTHPLSHHRSLNGNGATWLRFKTWMSRPSPRECFDTPHRHMPNRYLALPPSSMETPNWPCSMYPAKASLLFSR